MKKICSIILSISLFFCYVVNLNTVVSASQLESSLILQSTALTSGLRSTDLEAVFSTSSENVSNVTLENLEIAVDNERIALSGHIFLNNLSYNIETQGVLYRFLDGDAKSIYLIDFTDTDEIHFVQARLEEIGNDILIHLIIQMYSDESFVYFRIPLYSKININDIKNISITNDNDTAFSLYNLSQNVISSDDSIMTVSSSNENISISVDQDNVDIPQMRASYNTSVSYNDWASFFSAVRRNGTVKLDNYNIDNRIFNTGWVFLNNSNSYTNKYSLACYTSQNGAYEKLIQIVFLKLVHHSSSALYASLQMTVEESMILSYNEDYKTFRISYGVGPYIDQLNLGLTVPGGSTSRTVFTSKKLEASLEDNTNQLNSVIALVPYLSTAYDVWNLLTTNGRPTNIGVLTTYEDTYDKQRDAYGSKVYRVIAGTTGNHKLTKIGHTFVIRGDIYAGYSNCSSWKYQYSAHHL